MKEVDKRAEKAFAKLDETKKQGSELFKGENFILVFYEEGFTRASALASKLAASTKKISLVLSLLSGNKSRYLLTARSPDKINGKDIDLLEILEDFKVGYDGGGLEKAASLTIRKNQLGELIEYLEIKDAILSGESENDNEKETAEEAS
jgi:single-stranded DNA-specific DHH superfamily exonuclease